VHQRGRWYPTAAVLANGSILVMGGETGSNAGPQPNLEILPKPVGGDTVVELEWLARTDPNNLYPFIFILPTERVFVGKSNSNFYIPTHCSQTLSGYWNEARILDPVTFDTVQELPNMPGAVDNCKQFLLYHAPTAHTFLS
jgi:hypothetical protein